MVVLASKGIGLERTARIDHTNARRVTSNRLAVANLAPNLLAMGAAIFAKFQPKSIARDVTRPN